MAIKSGDRARFNRRTKRLNKTRERIRAYKATLAAAAVAIAPPVEPKVKA